MNFSLPPKTIQALQWIVPILEKRNIPYQISGGLSAKLYGSARPLNDIDIDIPDKNFQDILDEVRPYIIYGPERYVDGKWDAELMTLDYQGQIIDIGGGTTPKITNKERTEWIPIPTDFFHSVKIKIAGLEVDVIPPEELITYKQHLDGEHQLQDIEAAKLYAKNSFD